MMKADFAELILSMTMPPGPAASIVGDLEEETCARGTLWFWTTLLRTAVSASWRAFAESPLRLTGWALAGVMVQLLYGIAIGVPISVIMNHSNFGMALLPGDREAIAMFLITVGVAFRFGKWLVRRVPYRELPVFAIVSIVPYVFLSLLEIWIEPPADVSSPVSMVGALIAASGAIFTLAGIKRGRALAPKE